MPDHTPEGKNKWGNILERSPDTVRVFPNPKGKKNDAGWAEWEPAQAVDDPVVDGR